MLTTQCVVHKVFRITTDVASYLFGLIGSIGSDVFDIVSSVFNRILGILSGILDSIFNAAKEAALRGRCDREIAVRARRRRALDEKRDVAISEASFSSGTRRFIG